VRIRLALFAASPVYYQAPLYRRLTADPGIDFTAIFASSAGATRPVEDGYGRPVEWGIDALGGYRSVFLRRADRNPSGGGVLALRDLDVVTLLVRERYDVLWLHGYHTVTHIAAALTQRALGGSLMFREEQTLFSPRPRWKTAVKSVGLRAFFRGSYGLLSARRTDARSHTGASQSTGSSILRTSSTTTRSARRLPSSRPGGSSCGRNSESSAKRARSSSRWAG
jgi:hypothetical protein